MLDGWMIAGLGAGWIAAFAVAVYAAYCARQDARRTAGLWVDAVGMRNQCRQYAKDAQVAKSISIGYGQRCSEEANRTVRHATDAKADADRAHRAAAEAHAALDYLPLWVDDPVRRAAASHAVTDTHAEPVTTPADEPTAEWVYAPEIGGEAGA